MSKNNDSDTDYETDFDNGLTDDPEVREAIKHLVKQIKMCCEKKMLKKLQKQKNKEYEIDELKKSLFKMQARLDMIDNIRNLTSSNKI